MFQDLLNDPLQKDILGMLIASNLPIGQKEVWIELVPHMNEKQKEELKALLKEELAYEIEMANRAIDRK